MKNRCLGSLSLFCFFLSFLPQVQEWLCLNCQMQRALGMDMTTPRSKSQQQIHSPSHAAKPELKLDPVTQPTLQTQTPPQTQPPGQAHPVQAHPAQAHQPQAHPAQAHPPQAHPPQAHPGPGPIKQTGPAGPGQQHIKPPPGAVPLPGMAKAPSQPDLSRNSHAHQPHHPRQDQTRSAGSSPSRQPPPPEQTFGKLFGFGASLLNQASTLISETTQPQQQPPKPAPKPGGPPGPGPGAGKPSGPQPVQQGPRAPAPQQQQHVPPDSSKPKACCPLCKTNLNVGNTAEQPNYNTCTQCHQQVCNMCGFNPTPHLVEVRFWFDLFGCNRVSSALLPVHVFVKRNYLLTCFCEKCCVTVQLNGFCCYPFVAVWSWSKKLHFTGYCWEWIKYLALRVVKWPTVASVCFISEVLHDHRGVCLCWFLLSFLSISKEWSIIVCSNSWTLRDH